MNIDSSESHKPVSLIVRRSNGSCVESPNHCGLRPESLQLRDSADLQSSFLKHQHLREFDHAMAFADVSMSFRSIPYSGTFWRKKYDASAGELIIDLGEYVQGIDTFSVSQHLQWLCLDCCSVLVRIRGLKGRQRFRSTVVI